MRKCLPRLHHISKQKNCQQEDPRECLRIGNYHVSEHRFKRIGAENPYPQRQDACISLLYTRSHRPPSQPVRSQSPQPPPPRRIPCRQRKEDPEPHSLPSRPVSRKTARCCCRFPSAPQNMYYKRRETESLQRGASDSSGR